jgi:phosphinothricin acetyltransferase
VLVIRDADPARDGPACSAIYVPFVRDTAVTFDEDPPDGESMAQRIEAVMLSYPWIVAERDDAVAGYAYASRHRERPSYRWAAEVGIYVSEEQRGQGIGGALYAALLPMLSRQGLHVALAGITLPNPPSVALHEACGFEPVGVYRGVGWKAGAWRDVGWWQLRLSEDETPPEDPRDPVRLGGSRPLPAEGRASDRR